MTKTEVQATLRADGGTPSFEIEVRYPTYLKPIQFLIDLGEAIDELKPANGLTKLASRIRHSASADNGLFQASQLIDCISAAIRTLEERGFEVSYISAGSRARLDFETVTFLVRLSDAVRGPVAVSTSPWAAERCGG